MGLRIAHGSTTTSEPMRRRLERNERKDHASDPALEAKKTTPRARDLAKPSPWFGNVPALVMGRSHQGIGARERAEPTHGEPNSPRQGVDTPDGPRQPAETLNSPRQTVEIRNPKAPPSHVGTVARTPPGCKRIVCNVCHLRNAGAGRERRTGRSSARSSRRRSAERPERGPNAAEVLFTKPLTPRRGFCKRNSWLDLVALSLGCV